MTVLGNDSSIICNTAYASGSDEDVANAILIANAPQMFATLKGLLLHKNLKPNCACLYHEDARQIIAEIEGKKETP